MLIALPKRKQAATRLVSAQANFACEVKAAKSGLP
jgi:hypothetical protein